MSVLTNGLLAFSAVLTLPGLGQSIPPTIPLAELDKPQYNEQVITTSGTVVETFRDEIDPGWDFLILKDAGTFLPVSLAIHGDHNSSQYLDTLIRVTGIYRGRNDGVRTFAGPLIRIDNPSADNVTVLSPAPADPFDCEPLVQSQWIAPKDVVRLGRRSVSGTVLARWEDRQFAIRTDDGDTVTVRLRSGDTPQSGLHVSAVGYPVTDFYRLNLTRAIWREQPATQPSVPEPPERITPEQLFLDEEGRHRLQYLTYNGRLITLSGIIRHVAAGASGLHVDLSCQQQLLSVDIDTDTSWTASDLLPETEIEATGICLMECEAWNPDLVFPHIKACRLFVRKTDDIRILSRPPWWTPAKLLLVIGILLVGIAGFAAWSAGLRRLVHRRSRELLKEQIAHVSADLRTAERTRLAVELHDALSQNLEGVAFQIAASKDLLAVSPETAGQTLDAASHMLLSSRTELKRCLFDLRHDALEARSFDVALRTTLEPISEDADLTIRFNVPRDIFSDTSAHAVLCIIRELVSNAVRHGRARHVRIAGEYHDGTIRFSVRDDGSGFDTSRCPGPDNGHFGLEGIRERVHRLNGVFAVESAPGGPTRAVVTVVLDPLSAAANKPLA